MSIRDLFKQLRQSLKVNIRAAAKEQNYPSGLEPGLKNVDSGAFALMRDDGVAEVSSGPAVSFLADGAGQMATVRGSSVSIQGRHVHLHAPPGGLWFGYQRFNAGWYSPPIDPLFTWQWRNAPIVQRFPGALGQLPPLGGGPIPLANATFLTGAPGPGQTLVPLADYLEARPLLGPNEQLVIIAQHLGELITSMNAELKEL